MDVLMCKSVMKKLNAKEKFNLVNKYINEDTGEVVAFGYKLGLYTIILSEEVAKGLELPDSDIVQYMDTENIAVFKSSIINRLYIAFKEVYFDKAMVTEEYTEDGNTCIHGHIFNQYDYVEIDSEDSLLNALYDFGG